MQSHCLFVLGPAHSSLIFTFHSAILSVINLGWDVLWELLNVALKSLGPILPPAFGVWKQNNKSMSLYILSLKLLRFRKMCDPRLIIIIRMEICVWISFPTPAAMCMWINIVWIEATSYQQMWQMFSDKCGIHTVRTAVRQSMLLPCVIFVCMSVCLCVCVCVC